MLVAPLARRRSTCFGDHPSHSFAIVIPAHNEESILKSTLKSCAALDYPAEKIAIYVIADNCTDRTADTATQCGVHCLVRTDAILHGKGHALEWAIPQVLAAGYDAIVVLDADCSIDRHALQVFDERLLDGDRVLQASYVAANPDGNTISYVLALANALENDCFYASKSLLGLAVSLRGTGMVFHRDVLLKYPWQARSIAEDAEYTYRLLLKSVPVRFVPNARVTSDFPVAHDQLAVQRTRWIGGGMRVAATWAPRLLWKGLRHGRLALIDAVLTMFIASRFLILAQLCVTWLLSLLCLALFPGLWSVALSVSCLAVTIAYLLYAAVGLALIDVQSASHTANLPRVPSVVVGYLIMALSSLLKLHHAKSSRWNRTPRINESNKS